MNKGNHTPYLYLYLYPSLVPIKTKWFIWFNLTGNYDGLPILFLCCVIGLLASSKPFFPSSFGNELAKFVAFHCLHSNWCRTVLFFSWIDSGLSLGPFCFVFVR